MPTYVYECRPCNKIFTQIRPSKDRNLPPACPKCGKTSTKRLFAQPFAIESANKANTPREAKPPTVRPGNVRQPDYLVENVSIVNFKNGTGVRLSGEVSVEARNLYLSGNRVGIEIRDDAQLHDDGTVIN